MDLEYITQDDVSERMKESESLSNKHIDQHVEMENSKFTDTRKDKTESMNRDRIDDRVAGVEEEGIENEVVGPGRVRMRLKSLHHSEEPYVEDTEISNCGMASEINGRRPMETHNSNIPTNSVSFQPSNKPLTKDIEEWEAQAPKLLFAAIENGDAENAKRILDRRTNVDARGSDGSNPLHIACFKGDLNIVRLLLEEYVASAVASLKVEDSNGRLPIDLAAMGNHVDVLKYLMEKGSPLNHLDNDGLSAYHLAAQMGHDKCVHLFLQDSNFDPNIKDREGNTALQLVVSQQKDPALTQVMRELLLSSDKINLTLRNKKGFNVLHSAVVANNVDLVRHILKNLDETMLHEVMSEDASGNTPLQLAYHHERSQIVQLMQECASACEIKREALSKVIATLKLKKIPAVGPSSSGQVTCQSGPETFANVNEFLESSESPLINDTYLPSVQPFTPSISLDCSQFGDLQFGATDDPDLGQMPDLTFLVNVPNLHHSQTEAQIEETDVSVYIIHDDSTTVVARSHDHLLQVKQTAEIESASAIPEVSGHLPLLAESSNFQHCISADESVKWEMEEKTTSRKKSVQKYVKDGLGNRFSHRNNTTYQCTANTLSANGKMKKCHATVVVTETARGTIYEPKKKHELHFKSPSAGKKEVYRLRQTGSSVSTMRKNKQKRVDV